MCVYFHSGVLQMFGRLKHSLSNLQGNHSSYSSYSSLFALALDNKPAPIINASLVANLKNLKSTSHMSSSIYLSSSPEFKGLDKHWLNVTGLRRICNRG